MRFCPTLPGHLPAVLFVRSAFTALNHSSSINFSSLSCLGQSMAQFLNSRSTYLHDIVSFGETYHSHVSESESFS